MPPSYFLYLEDLEQIFDRPVTRRHVHALVLAGEFPPPRQLSPRKVAWRRQDIEAWLASRPPASSWVPPATTNTNAQASA